MTYFHEISCEIHRRNMHTLCRSEVILVVYTMAGSEIFKIFNKNFNHFNRTLPRLNRLNYIIRQTHSFVKLKSPVRRVNVIIITN